MKEYQMTDQTKRAPRKRVVSSADMEAFLASLNTTVRPTLHVNGAEYRNAILTVDFGEPLEPFVLSSDDLQELVTRMRGLAREVLGRDATININPDKNRGIMWASVG